MTRSPSKQKKIINKSIAKLTGVRYRNMQNLKWNEYIVTGSLSEQKAKINLRPMGYSVRKDVVNGHLIPTGVISRLSFIGRLMDI